MTNEDYSKVPPPHLLKKFSEQAREDSQKRGHPGYCKTFAKLCIDWAFQETAMEDLRVASAEVSGVELNSQPSSNDLQIRSSDITPPPELVEQWVDTYFGGRISQSSFHLDLATRAAQWGADQELDACCEWVSAVDGKYGPRLRLARRPQPKSLKEKALAALERYESEEWCEEMTFDSSIIREALEQLDD
jgi:hypothetical protein